MIKQDADDNKFVDCAIASNSDYIVTNDRHFEILKTIEFPKVQIVNVNEFKELLTTRS
ncbi:MAG: putative toxin-antitoxin system toxin component, PIN family [Cyclobacteriaceae bacterium]